MHQQPIATRVEQIDLTAHRRLLTVTIAAMFFAVVFPVMLMALAPHPGSSLSLGLWAAAVSIALFGSHRYFARR